jgi:FkbM family methyltransferase|tara:strand:- start:467 stop:1405 length:939 start_codon:yes stop_codon:yes gene_type:complete
MKLKLNIYISKIFKLISIIRNIKIKTFYHLLLKSSESMPIIERSDNKFGTFVGLSNDYIYQSAKEQGINEKHFEELASLIIKKDWNVVDVGANIGTHSIILSKLASDGKVFSFEPQSLTFSLLQNNLLLNSCKNVVSYRFALTDKEMEIVSMGTFFYNNDKINNGVVGIEKDNLIGDLTISKKFDTLNLPTIKFIKIDIQGSEVIALRGLRETLKSDRPIMIVEVEEGRLKSLGNTSKELIELLLSYNYTLFRIMSSYPCDHICVPKENADEFALSVLKKFSYKVEKIEGEKVELFFENKEDQNYKRIEIIK